MKNKKSENANLENKKGIFFLIGLVIALGSILMAFEWKTKPKAAMILGESTFTSVDFVYIPPTQEKIKLPPPKIEATEFVLVDNETEIENEFEGFESEPTEDNIFDLKGFVFNPKEEEPDKTPDYFHFVQEMPLFPGGEKALIKYLANNVNYPLIAQENGIEGKVYVSFIIDENGEIIDVNLVRGVDQSLDKEALRVIKSMPKWKPGKQRGKPVKVQFNVPILFELQ